MTLHDKNRDRKSKKFSYFILLSLLIHVALILFPWPKSPKKEALILIVDRIILPEKIRDQVVDDTQMANKLAPEETEFLSRNNNRVEKETKARRTGKTKNSQNAILIKPKKSRKALKEAPKKKKLTIADLGLRPHQNRKPSTYAEPSKTDDYLPEVETGTETSLNTREFQFFSYFERIKDRLRMYWEPQLKRNVNYLYAHGRRLPDFDLITKLKIILNKNGELSKISITRNSGIEEIDGAAVKAFELASPFPNPPRGMVEKNGYVNLTWSFVVETRGISNVFVFLSQR